jgi:phage terminase large subunit GpA-like protein
METNNEDVRLDWELIAHTTSGVTYSINHGSIGTFKRNRKKTNLERSNESERDKYTYSHGQRFSVWPVLKELINKNYIGQSGDAYNIDITVIDTGFFTRLAYDFIKSVNDAIVVGIKGYTEDEYRKLNKDTPVIQRSREMANNLYILQVNQLKDILASNMKLSMGMDGFQPYGFMNFPQSSMGKYAMKSYFSHFESEHRVPLMKGDIEIGFAWKKKNSDVENHFFDVYVYNLAAREIYIDILRKSYPKYSKLTWDDFVNIVDG